jgi:Carboxypeptidase regulatory-like domain
MLPAGKRLRLSLFCILLIASVALLASGCLWGRVIDSDTGAPIAGASVSYVDSYGHTGTAITNSGGLYWFDSAAGPVPALGPVTINVSAPGYAPFSQPTLVQYDDNPNASLANLSSFWEVRSFSLVPQGSQQPTADLAVTDLFPDNMPQGEIFVRITNNGPDSLDGVAADLSCGVTREPRLCVGNACQPISFASLNFISISLDPGQTGIFDTGLPVNTDAFTYIAECTVEAPTDDPDPANNSYSEPIPGP